MTCPNCHKSSTHIKIDPDGNVTCSKCGNFSETGGSKTDKILTRNSSRITEQQVQHEADMQPPYKIDKNTNKVIINEDFVELYPEQSKETFTEQELRQSGNGDLIASKKQDAEGETDGGATFSGTTEQGITDIMEVI